MTTNDGPPPLLRSPEVLIPLGFVLALAIWLLWVGQAEPPIHAYNPTPYPTEVTK